MTIKQNTNNVHNIDKFLGVAKAHMKIPDIYIFPVKLLLGVNVER